jgi:spiro-SPASM protein
VEIYYSDPDVRDTRLSFRSGNLREKVIMERILERHGAVPRSEEIRDAIIKNPEVLFAGPSFIEVELSGRCDLDCLFCYRKTLEGEHGDMELPVFMSILEGMRHFRLPYSICFGGSGEPLMHGMFYRVCEAALKEELLSTIVIETNGIYADDNFRSFLSTAAGGVIKVVVNINGYDGETYRALHGNDYFEQVYQNIMKLQEVAAPGSLYVQIMKINETDTFLDRYYDFWEKTGVPIILQKQNVYQGRIQDRRYSDLSPIERTSCWHLQRDMYILADGRIAFCKQDVDGSNARGSLKDTALPELFERARNDFLQDYRGRYQTFPDCSSCDEWYTFNL